MMKKAASLILILSSMAPTHSALADDFQCPLGNPIFKNIRAAAAVLEQEILLPKGCEAIAKQLNEANQEISSSVKALSNLQQGQSMTPAAEAQGESHVAVATAGITQVSNIFSQFNKSNDHCGKAIVSKGDYIIAFVDTINGMTPLIMAFGGPSVLPQAFGLMVITTAMNNFMKYYTGLNVDMSTTEAREVFKGHVCGYYSYNLTLERLDESQKRGKQDALRNQTRLQQEVATLEAEDDLPPAPQVSAEIAALDQELKKDQSFFDSLKQVFDRANSSSFLSCGIIRSQVEAAQKESAFPAAALARLESLVKLTEQETGQPDANRNLLVAARPLLQLELFPAPEQDAAACARRAQEWVTTISNVLQASALELNQPGRLDLSRSEAAIKRAERQKARDAKKAELLAIDRKITAFTNQGSRGSHWDLSELHDIRESIRRELFGNGKDRAFLPWIHRKGPAESWLRFKWRSAGLQLNRYRSLMKYLRKGWLKDNVTHFADESEKRLACAYASNAKMSNEGAYQDIQSASFLCELFTNTIEKYTHPYVTEYCQGKFDKEFNKIQEGKFVLKSKEIEAIQPEFEKLLKWRQDAGCEIPDPLILPGA